MIKYYLFLLLSLVSASAIAALFTIPENTLDRINGSIRTVMEYEEDEINESDLDISSYLRFDVQRLFDDRLSFHFYGRYRQDLDGRTANDKALNRSQRRIFQAYFDFDDSSFPFLVRAGRQWVHEASNVYIDGLLLKMDWLDTLRLTVFGGIPVPAYSASASDLLYGGRIDYQPFSKTRFSVTAVRSDDNNPNVNDHIGLRIEQGLGQSARVYYYQSFLNKREQDLQLGGSVYINRLQMQLQFSYYRLLSRTPRPDRDDIDGRYFSRFALILDQMQQLERYNFTATKYFGEHFAASGGFYFTRIREKENPTNRDSNHYFVSLQFFDILIKNLNFSIAANRVTTNASLRSSELVSDSQLGQPSTDIVVFTTARQDDDTYFITGELEYAFRKGLTAGLGASYGSYEFDRALSSTQPVSDQVLSSLRVTDDGQTFITRSYFARTQWKINRQWALRLFAEYNRSKINSGVSADDYWRFVGSVNYRF